MADIKAGEDTLKMLVGKSDGIQKTYDRLSSRRHFSNTLFNIMRGGTFPDDYYIEKDDFRKHLKSYSKQSDKSFEDLLSSLPERFTYQSLIEITGKIDNNDLIRLSKEYLPLIFSRRHGDPSRPWNKFDIQLKNADGSLSKYYEGNWRDIFQNWEALSYSYPGFLPGMISRFLNASTIDGYNPYRITRDGIDWEVQDPNDSWSFIGYWGDHQIIYLLRLLELSEKFFPGDLKEIMDKKIFSFANVPYRIVPYEKIISNPKETIDFDFKLNKKINSLVDELGNDGRLLLDEDMTVQKVSFTEKILISTLTRIYNLVPDAGIWMNTQRPEWNDANNALVGNGASLVTLYHLRRMIKFLWGVYSRCQIESFSICKEVSELFIKIHEILIKYSIQLSGIMPGDLRMKFMDDMGEAGSKYREKVYSGKSSEDVSITKAELLNFMKLTLNYCDHTIRRNKRKDGLYNSYMLIEIGEDTVNIEPLQEMLEGQAAVLNSGLLSLDEAEGLIQSLFDSTLYRPDQKSFTLYPDKVLPDFLENNNIPETYSKHSSLIIKLLEANNSSIINCDVNGVCHFNSSFINVDVLIKELKDLPPEYNELVDKEGADLVSLYESVFNHKSFTGRSGSFYKYEGLGSIYWHMVSKLLLAIGENICNANNNEKASNSFKNLTSFYYRVREGIGVHKSPDEYGAFPLDPYSHTPSMSGVQQPGLTGQVKEDIISRLMELGIFVEEGHIKFNPLLLRKSELPPPGAENEIFEYSFCNIPVNYSIGEKNEIAVLSTDNKNLYFPGLVLDRNISEQIFARTGSIKRLKITLIKNDLLDFS
ncbi:MAG: hypothetical protein QNK33_11545 [Bacteroidales bacterium]|nr:hypothetical protein [Bacteroidales bacterium]